MELTNSMSYCGTRYAVLMILPHGSTGGLPDFVEISQIAIIGSDPNFIVKLLNSCYYDHFRGFVLEHSGKVTLLHIHQLGDTYPLAAYCVGGNGQFKMTHYCSIMCSPDFQLCFVFM